MTLATTTGQMHSLSHTVTHTHTHTHTHICVCVCIYERETGENRVEERRLDILKYNHSTKKSAVSLISSWSN